MTKIKYPKITPHDITVEGMLYLLKTEDVPNDGDLYSNEDGNYFVCHSLRNNLQIGFPGTPYKVLPYIISDTEDINKNDTVLYANQFWDVFDVSKKNDTVTIHTSIDGAERPGNLMTIQGLHRLSKVIVYPHEFNSKIYEHIVSKGISQMDTISVRCNLITDTENEYEISLTPDKYATLIFTPRKNANPYKKNSFEYIAHNYCVSKNITTKLVRQLADFAKSDETRKFWFELFRTSVH